MRSVVVTGTSTGIGWGIAKVLTAKGFRVFGSVRKKADADRLSAELGSRFVPLLFDVTDEAAVQAAATEVRAALGGETLAGLVNNAGIAVAGPLLNLPISAARHRPAAEGQARPHPQHQLSRRAGRRSLLPTTPRSLRSKACPRAFGASCCAMRLTLLSSRLGR